MEGSTKSTFALLGALLATSCGGLTGEPSPWILSSVYDVSAVSRMGDSEEYAPDYTWLAAPGMTASCGAARTPVGLGIMEAEALGTGMTPAIAILLEEHPLQEVPTHRSCLEQEKSLDECFPPLTRNNVAIVYDVPTEACQATCEQLDQLGAPVTAAPSSPKHEDGLCPEDCVSFCQLTDRPET